MVVGKWESMRGGFGRDSILWTGSGFALILNLMQDRFKGEEEEIALKFR